MPHLTETLTVALPIEEVFAYLADFTNLEEWDPTVGRATQETPGGPGMHTRVRVEFPVGPVSIPLTYETTRYESPTRVTFEAQNPLVVGVDDVHLASSGDSTTVEWRAEFAFAGPGRLLDPLVGPGFRKVGDRAVGGLRARLAELEREAARQTSA